MKKVGLSADVSHSAGGCHCHNGPLRGLIQSLINTLHLDVKAFVSLGLFVQSGPCLSLHKVSLTSVSILFCQKGNKQTPGYNFRPV